MVQRLYRDDSYLIRFSARVVRRETAAGGLASLELDRTAFYPTGGGQPHDTGRLSGRPVLEVREAGDGRILHMVRAADAEAMGDGLDVAGEIDWTRRFDHMQQHSGQHILSRAFVEVAGAATSSFHLGEASCTIDLDGGALGLEALRRAEARANEVVFGDEPVEVRHLAADQAPLIAGDMGLARELALKPGDPIRIIVIGGFDESPCGGTHVRRAGEVGAISVRSWERFKGGTRVTFLCGARVVRAVEELGGVVDAIGERLSSPSAGLAAAVERLQQQLVEARREAKALSSELAVAEAASLDAAARDAGGCRVIVGVLEGRTAEQAQQLASTYVRSPGRIALLAATASPGEAVASLVFARSEQGIPASLKMGEILSAVCGSRGGRGGGGACLARGGGLVASTAAAALDEAFEIIRARLTSSHA